MIADQIVTALKTALSYGCPACHGDCGSANPPVSGCPMQEYQAALTAALAAAPPVVDAAADWVCALLAEKAEATETGDKNGWLYKWEVESISAVIRSLHARAVRAEAERDEARRLLAEAKEALKPFSALAGELFAQNYNNPDVIVGLPNDVGDMQPWLFFDDFRRARATLARLDAALTGDAP